MSDRENSLSREGQVFGDRSPRSPGIRSRILKMIDTVRLASGEWNQEDVLQEGWCSTRSATNRFSTWRWRYVVLLPTSIHTSRAYRGKMYQRYAFDAGCGLQSANDSHLIIVFSASNKLLLQVADRSDLALWQQAISNAMDSYCNTLTPPACSSRVYPEVRA